MRVEAWTWRATRIGGISAGILCVACRVGFADAVPVNFSVEYQHVEEQGTTRDLWARSVDASYFTHLSPSLQLASQFRLNELSYVGHEQRSVTPYGDLRLFSPTFGLTSSYRPSSQTDLGGITTRQREGEVTGFLARPNLPRLDVQWTRRAQVPGALVPATTSTTRLGRLSWTRGSFDVHGGGGDLIQSTTGQALGIVHEKNWDAGLGYHVAHANWTMQATGNVMDVHRKSDAGLIDGNRATSADLAFAQKFSKRADWTASYQLRIVDTGVGLQRNLTTHEGALIGNYHPTRTTQFLLGAGVRPVAGTNGDTRTLGYGLASAAVQGRVRPGWTGVATAAQTLNRQPGGAWYGVTSLRAGSKWILARGLKVDLDGTVTSNSDTAAHDTRALMQTQLGVTANPLRPWFLTASVRGYRTGPSLATSSAHSFAQTLSLHWQPSGKFDASVDLSQSGALPRGTPRLASHEYALHFKPSARLQMDAQQSGSNSRRVSATNGFLAGSEAWSGHLVIGLGRRWFLRSGASIVDPGKSTRSRQVDATLSARL